MTDINDVNVSGAVDTTPRGDLIAEIFQRAEDMAQAKIIGVVDPVTDVQALVNVGSGTVTAIPASVFDDYLTYPRARRGVAVHTDLDSFIAYVNRFKSPDTSIFACDDRTKPSLTAVIDYHRAGYEGLPEHGRHRATFAFPLSDEWKAWNEKNAKGMSMTDFAEFLEDRIVNVMAPSDVTLNEEQARFVATIGGRDRIAGPTELFELSRGLSVHDQQAVREAVKLSSGETELSFVSQHTDGEGRPISIPHSFLIAIPVFRNGPAYVVLARLRYRKNGPQITFFYELWGVDRVFDHAFDEACDEVREQTERTVFIGAPETKGS